jgi:hypothetical protein
MAIRLLITDTAWAAIAPRLAAVKHKAGSPPELRDRLFIEAVPMSPAPASPGEICRGSLAIGMRCTTASAVGRPGHLAATLGVPAPRWLSCGPTPLH